MKKPKQKPVDPVAVLMQQVKDMKRFADIEWRDLEPGSTKWNRYVECFPALRKEMDDWAHGPILHIGEPLSQFESDYFAGRLYAWAKYNPRIPTVGLYKFLLETLLDNTTLYRYTHIYPKGFPKDVTVAIQTLLRWSKAKARIIPELINEHGQHWISKQTEVDYSEALFYYH